MTASGTTSSSSFGKARVNIEILHATTSVTDALNNPNVGAKKQIKTVNETGAPDVQAELGLPGMRINSIGDHESGKAQFEAIKVSIRDPVWSAPIPSVCKLVGLPIRVPRIPSGVETQTKQK